MFSNLPITYLWCKGILYENILNNVQEMLFFANNSHYNIYNIYTNYVFIIICQFFYNGGWLQTC